MNRAVLDGMLGFTGSVMVAASFRSLLAPEIEMSLGCNGGFFRGSFFVWVEQNIAPLHINFKENEKEGIKTPWHRTALLTLAITLHNIPKTQQDRLTDTATMGFIVGLPS